jgi:hypothetical protein
MPLWLSLFEQLDCRATAVVCLRSPVEVALSLKARDALSEPEACLLWVNHMLDAEYHSRVLARSFVTYEGLLRDWRAVAERLTREIDVHWPTSYESADSEIADFLDSSLRNQVAERMLQKHPICLLAQELFFALQKAPLDFRELDGLRSRALELTEVVAPWARRAGSERELARRVLSVEADQAILLAELSRMRSTVSWRITSPLRGIANIFIKRWYRRRHDE